MSNEIKFITDEKAAQPIRFKFSKILGIFGSLKKDAEGPFVLFDRWLHQKLLTDEANAQLSLAQREVNALRSRNKALEIAIGAANEAVSLVPVKGKSRQEEMIAVRKYDLMVDSLGMGRKK